MMTKSEKTREDVLDLIAQWESDPVWDIEGTPGFEAYADELRKHREAKEREWAQDARDRLMKKAEELGSPGNVKLAAYVKRLEDRLSRLEDKVYGDPS